MPTTGRRVSRRETVVPRRFHPGARRNRRSRHNQEPCRTPTNRAVLLSSTPHRTAPCSSVLLQPLLHTAEPVRAGVVSEWVVGRREAGPAERGRSQRGQPSHRSAFCRSEIDRRKGAMAVAGSRAGTAGTRRDQFRSCCTGHDSAWPEVFSSKAFFKIIFVPDWGYTSPGQKLS